MNRGEKERGRPQRDEAQITWPVTRDDESRTISGHSSTPAPPPPAVGQRLDEPAARRRPSAPLRDLYTACRGLSSGHHTASMAPKSRPPGIRAR